MGPNPVPGIKSGKVKLTCLYCSHDWFEPFFERVTDRLNFVEGEWRFLRCKSCGSASLSSLPSSEEIASFYPKLYGFYPNIGQNRFLARTLASLEFSFYFKPLYQRQTQILMKALKFKSGKGMRLLDIGCGSGIRLRELKECGFSVHGFDFDGAMIDHLKSHTDIPAICADVTDLSKSYPAESFDLLTAFNFVEHLNNVRNFLSDSLSLLKPGGWLAIMVPMMDSLQATVFRDRWACITEAPRHVSVPTRKGMLGALRRGGFEQSNVLSDCALNSAGIIALSLVRESSTAHLYGSFGMRRLVKRLVAGGITLAAIPLCFINNRFARVSSSAIFLAQKPHGID